MKRLNAFLIIVITFIIFANIAVFIYIENNYYNLTGDAMLGLILLIELFFLIAALVRINSPKEHKMRKNNNSYLDKMFVDHSLEDLFLENYLKNLSKEDRKEYENNSRIIEEKINVIKREKVSDFKVMFGVGPKIDEYLKNSGITTFKQLADIDIFAINHDFVKGLPTPSSYKFKDKYSKFLFIIFQAEEIVSKMKETNKKEVE